MKIPRTLPFKTAYGAIMATAKNLERSKNEYDQNNFCGTKFCRAGWMYATVTGDKPVDYSLMTRVVTVAGVVSGVWGEAKTRATHAQRRAYDRLISSSNERTDYSTKIGARGLRNYARRFATQLRSINIRRALKDVKA